MRLAEHTCLLGYFCLMVKYTDRICVLPRPIVDDHAEEACTEACTLELDGVAVPVKHEATCVSDDSFGPTACVSFRRRTRISRPSSEIGARRSGAACSGLLGPDSVLAFRLALGC
jgi:hypothetical protein